MGFEWLADDPYYKRHFICLPCKKGFKRASTLEIKNAQNLQNERVNCPQCRKKMIQVPYTFEVPPKRDQKAWKQLAQQYANKD